VTISLKALIGSLCQYSISVYFRHFSIKAKRKLVCCCCYSYRQDCTDTEFCYDVCCNVYDVLSFYRSITFLTWTVGHLLWRHYDVSVTWQWRPTTAVVLRRRRRLTLLRTRWDCALSQQLLFTSAGIDYPRQLYCVDLCLGLIIRSCRFNA